MNKTVEAVSFSLVTGAAPSAFLSANGKINEWLRKQPGFLRRELSRMDDGAWLDVLHWQSLGDAKNAADKIMAELGDSECMAMIDPATIKMSHGELCLAI